MNEQNPPEGIHGVSRLGDFSAYFIVNKLWKCEPRVLVSCSIVSRLVYL